MEARERQLEGLEGRRERAAAKAGLAKAGLLGALEEDSDLDSAPVNPRGTRGWVNGTGADLDVLSAPRSWWPTDAREILRLGEDADQPGSGPTWRSLARTYLDGNVRVPSGDPTGAILHRRITHPVGPHGEPDYLEKVIRPDLTATQAASAALPYSMRYVQGQNLSAAWHRDGIPVHSTPNEQIDWSIRTMFVEEELFARLPLKEDETMSTISDTELHERLVAVEEGLQHSLRELVVTAALLSQRMSPERRQELTDNVVPLLVKRMRTA